MKTPFPDYLISIDDARFIPVLRGWVTQSIYHIQHEQHINHSMEYASHVEFWIGNHAGTLEESIRKDLRKFVSLYAGSPVHQVIVGYCTTRGNTDEIRAIINRIESKIVKNRAKMSTMSAFHFSARVHDDLLDYMIPDLNLVLIDILPTSKPKLLWVQDE